MYSNDRPLDIIDVVISKKRCYFCDAIIIELPGNRWFRSTLDREITPWDSCYICVARKAGLSGRYARFIALPEPCPIRVRVDRNNIIVTIFRNIYMYPRVDSNSSFRMEGDFIVRGDDRIFPKWKKIVAIMRIITRWTSFRSETTIL